MGYNTSTIKTLRWGFEPDESDKYTNCALIFAYNGTGKTRLSYDFAHYERTEDSPKHTLYYNAYTEDLFTWDNDLEGNTDYRLLINQDSELIRGLAGYAINLDIKKYLSVFSDIDFGIEYKDDIPASVSFSKTCKKKETVNGELQEKDVTIENIKISRGEERLFVWCFFRCIMEQVLNGNVAYKDIEYVYIDDPMSSLDDNNVIAFAAQLYNVIREALRREKDDMRAGREVRRIKFVVSSHHALFFHTMQHGLEKDKLKKQYYLSRDKQSNELTLKDISDTTPFYYNVAMMSEIEKAIRADKLYTYHFTVLRSVMEKIKEFFGQFDYRYILDGITYKGYEFSESAFTRGELMDLYSRLVNVFSHQGSMFAPSQMNDDNKELFKALFYHLKKKYKFVLPNLEDERSEREIHTTRR